MFKTIKDIRDDSKGDAVVEATILFPIMIMIFAGLVLLAAYLPTRAALQRATQYAATALATEYSDTWLFFDLGNMDYFWKKDKDKLGNVYSPIVNSFDDLSVRAQKIVEDLDLRLPSLKDGELSIQSSMSGGFVSREISVTASRSIASPIDLTIIGFPNNVVIDVTSTAAVLDGDEFLRNVDLAVSFADFIAEKFGFTDVGDAIGSLGSKFKQTISG